MSYLVFCQHGVEQADRPPCTNCHRAADFHYCAHGVDNWQQTSENTALCAYCRGITRRVRNSAVPGFSVGPPVRRPGVTAAG